MFSIMRYVRKKKSKTEDIFQVSSLFQRSRVSVKGMLRNVLTVGQGVQSVVSSHICS